MSDYKPLLLACLSFPLGILRRRSRPAIFPPQLFLDSSSTGWRRLTIPAARNSAIFTRGLVGFLRTAMFLSGLLPILLLTGCDALQKKHDNPVMVAAPRRVEPEEENDEEIELASGKQNAPKIVEDEGADQKEIRKALTKNPWKDWKDDTTIFNSQVAATVNGVPILNGDVLDRYAGWLIIVREEMQKVASDPKSKGQAPTPDDYEKLRYQVIQREIAQYIQKKVLVECLKSGMKPEQLKLMDGHVDELFEKEIAKLKYELKVNSKTELEIALNKKGTTLKNVRDNFALDRLAGEAINIKSDKPKQIDRADLIEYYTSHPDLFNVTAKVKWEQIQVSFDASFDKAAARKKLEQAIAEVKKGTPFETVARKYSDGPTAKDGGAWDWMEEGNLADTKLEKKLFEMPTNVLSQVHEGPESVCVIRVTERQEAGRRPFKEVQLEIKDLIEKEQHQERYKKVMKKIFANAVIESQYNLPKFVPDE